MKHIIMADTVNLICKTQEELRFLLENGYILKKTEDGLEYLVREEKEEKIQDIQ